MFRPIWIGAALVAIGMSGCATQVDGAPSRVPATITADGVELELLDTGNFPSRPLPVFGAAGTREIGADMEALRLSDYVVLTGDIDPSLVNGQMPARAYATSEELDALLPVPSDSGDNPMVAAAAAHDFVAGYGTSRFRAESGADRLALQKAVLIFPDAASASAAATEMSAAFATAWPDIPATPAQIPGHPDAVAFSDDFGSGPQVKSFSATGPYVLYERAAATTVEAAARLVATTIDAQQELLTQFTPTDPAKLADLPRDPTGLLSRTLLAADYQQTGEGRVRDPAGTLHGALDPVEYQRIYDKADVVSIATGQLSTVWESRLDDGGAVVRDEFADLNTVVRGLEPSPGVSGMPNVRCVRRPSTLGDAEPYTWCYGSAGQYAFSVEGLQEAAVHQMAAAQYLMLTTG